MDIPIPESYNYSIGEKNLVWYDFVSKLNPKVTSKADPRKIITNRKGWASYCDGNERENMNFKSDQKYLSQSIDALLNDKPLVIFSVFSKYETCKANEGETLKKSEYQGHNSLYVYNKITNELLFLDPKYETVHIKVGGVLLPKRMKNFQEWIQSTRGLETPPTLIKPVLNKSLLPFYNQISTDTFFEPFLLLIVNVAVLLFMFPASTYKEIIEKINTLSKNELIRNYNSFYKAQEAYLKKQDCGTSRLYNTETLRCNSRKNLTKYRIETQIQQKGKKQKGKNVQAFDPFEKAELLNEEMTLYEYNITTLIYLQQLFPYVDFYLPNVQTWEEARDEGDVSWIPINKGDIDSPFEFNWKIEFEHLLKRVNSDSNKTFAAIPLFIDEVTEKLEEEGTGHVNMLIWDKKTKTLERWEPHGSNTKHLERMNVIELDKVLEKLVESLIKKKVLPVGSQYLSPIGFCPIGLKLFQLRDEGLEMAEGGQCQTWANWFLMMRLKYPNDSREVLIQRSIKTFGELKGGTLRYILNFTANLIKEGKKIKEHDYTYYLKKQRQESKEGSSNKQASSKKDSRKKASSKKVKKTKTPIKRTPKKKTIRSRK